MSDIILRDTVVENNRVTFDYTYPKEWNLFVIDSAEKLFAEYSFPLNDIPKSILNIPFVANMMVFAMLENRTIYVDELDKSFLDAVPQIIDGYRSLYAERIVGCTVKCGAVIDNSYDKKEYRIMAFTGGVDASSALASHIDEKIVLANIWGGDIRLEYEGRYLSHKKYFEELTSIYDLGFEPIKSNFRFIYDEGKIPHKFDHDWWSAMGHSLLIVATFAPVAYKWKAEKVYLASSYTLEEYAETKPACCNAMEIVNAVKYGSCVTEQCDLHLTRIDKINNIVSHFGTGNKHIKILACWNHQKDTVVNCCECEKCYRTIMNIKACKADPRDFGFDVDDQIYEQIKRMVIYSESLPYEMWNEIQNAFIKEKNYWEKDENVNWLFDVKINCPPEPVRLTIIQRVFRKSRVIINYIKRKIQNMIK